MASTTAAFRNEKPRTLEGVIATTRYSGECKLTCHYQAETGNATIELWVLKGEDKGALAATATIPYPALPNPLDEVIIKDYTENVGMVEILQKAGVIGMYLGNCPAPYSYPVYTLLRNPFKE